MDQESEPEPMELGEEDQSLLFVFPTPDQSRVNLFTDFEGKRKMQWTPTPVPEQYLNSKKQTAKYTDPTLLPNYLDPIRKDRQILQDYMTMVGKASLLPFVVYQSPLLTMLTRGPNDQEARPAFTDTISLLNNLYVIIRYYAEFYPKQDHVNRKEKNRISNIYQQFLQDGKVADRYMEQQMDLIHARYAQTNEIKECITALLDLLVQFTFYLIHLYERIIWRVLVQPRLKTLQIELAHVLTPTSRPSFDSFDGEERKNFYVTALHYFAHKDAIRNADLVENGNKHLVRAWFSVDKLEERRAKYQNQLYAGWLDPETAYEYFQFTNLDYLLRQQPQDAYQQILREGEK